LRGILLAFHALTFIRAYYKALASDHQNDIPLVRNAIKLTTNQRDAAADVLHGARDGLTEDATRFFDEICARSKC
jgi:hypothetical protein